MAESYESDNPYEKEPEVDRDHLPSEKQLEEEIKAIEEEIRQKEIERLALIRKVKMQNLPVYRREGLNPTTKYRVFCVEIGRKKKSPIIFKTIALDGADCLSHIEQFFKGEAGDFDYIIPKWASKPDYPKNLQHLLKEDS